MPPTPPGPDRPRDGIPALSEREKETLRLLLGGHDAKSIARRLGRSVHTVNERLRDARRKLGVTGSREAARLLAAAEGGTPEKVVDERFGMADRPADMLPAARATALPATVHRLVWLSGGMLTMSLLIAVAALSSMLHAGAAPPLPAAAGAPAPVPPAATTAARAWLALLDRGAWQESWSAAADLFTAQLTASAWTAMIRPLREPLGAAGAREVRSEVHASSLPGVPPGDYAVIQFHTAFARSEAIETVTLVRARGSWRVAGYFLR